MSKVEFIGMIQTQKVSEIHAAHGPTIDRDYLRAFAQAHEQAGFDRVLVPHHSTGRTRRSRSPMPLPSPSASTSCSRIARASWRPRWRRASSPSLDQLSGGRLAVHYISGGSDEEQKRDGDWLDHDRRYARTDEYLEVLRKVWTADKPFDPRRRALPASRRPSPR